MKLLIRAFLAVLLVLAVVGCEKVVYRDREPEPEPPPPPPPGLTGTWNRTATFVEDGQMRTEVMYLTLTAERFIEGFVLLNADGMVIDDWHHQGTWEATDTTITKVWGDPATDSVVKSFYWGDAQHGSIFVNCWTCDHRETSYERMERIAPDVLDPANLFGTWSLQTEEGVTSVTIAPDGTFLYTFPEPGKTELNTITGKGSLDLDNYYINLTDLVRYDADNGETRVFLGFLDGVDGTGRVAFAPAPNGIRVSPLWSEPPADMLLHQAFGHELEPYGNYWMLLTKPQ